VPVLPVIFPPGVLGVRLAPVRPPLGTFSGIGDDNVQVSFEGITRKAHLLAGKFVPGQAFHGRDKGRVALNCVPGTLKFKNSLVFCCVGNNEL
jgi:hypothetical protein